MRLDDADAATSELAEAVRLLDGLLHEVPGDFAARLDLAQSLRRLAGNQLALGHEEASYASLLGACRNWHQLLEHNNLPAKDRLEMAKASQNLGIRAHRRDDQENARLAFRMAVEALQQIENARLYSDSRTLYAQCLTQCGHYARQDGDNSKAIAHYEAALREWSKLGQHVNRQTAARQHSEVLRKSIAELTPASVR